MTCYYIPDVKTLQILSLHFVPTLQSAVYILYLVYILYPVYSLHFVLTGIRGTNTVYFWLQLFAQHTIYHKMPVCELIPPFRSFRVNSCLHHMFSAHDLILRCLTGSHMTILSKSNYCVRLHVNMTIAYSISCYFKFGKGHYKG